MQVPESGRRMLLRPEYYSYNKYIISYSALSSTAVSNTEGEYKFL